MLEVERNETARNINQKTRTAYEKAKLYTYYFIVGIVSFVALVFLPMLSSEVGMEWAFPASPRGWIVWIVCRLIIATINVVIFYSFIEQGKTNVRDEEKYKKANEILAKTREAHIDIPRSPNKWRGQIIIRKSSSIFFFSMLSLIAFSQALLAYDWATFLGYIFTIVCGIIFGILNMKKTELYWTDEYLEYALMIQNKEKEEKEKDQCSQEMAKSTET